MLTDNLLMAANMEWFDFDTVPYEEQCAQVGEPDALQKMKDEVKRTKALLIQKFGEPPIGVLIRPHRNEHDFGSYYSLRVYYNPNLPDAVAYAFACEGDFPRTWEDTAPVDWRRYRSDQTSDDTRSPIAANPTRGGDRVSENDVASPESK